MLRRQARAGRRKSANFAKVLSYRVKSFMLSRFSGKGFDSPQVHHSCKLFSFSEKASSRRVLQAYPARFDGHELPCLDRVRYDSGAADESRFWHFLDIICCNAESLLLSDSDVGHTNPRKDSRAYGLTIVVKCLSLRDARSNVASPLAVWRGSARFDCG